MFSNGVKKEYISQMRTNSMYSNNSSNSSYNNYARQTNMNSTNTPISASQTTPSVKEVNHISHYGTPDRKKSSFSIPEKNPYWPDNLWKEESATLVYSYKNPEKCLSPPRHKSDQTLRFNSRFESGNLLYAYKLNQSSYHCILENDPTEQCQWFYFQMTNVQIIPNSNRKMTFYISGFNKSSSVLSNGSKVFMYSEKLTRAKGVSWVRIGTDYAYGTSFKPESPDYKSNRRKRARNKSLKPKNYTLQFQVTFPYDDDVVYFCYGVPYTFTDLNNHISQWLRSSSTLIQSITLCKTKYGKNCPLLTITAPKSPSAQKKYIFITSRNHPGESNSSFVLHGLIDYLLSKQPPAEYLLNNFTFHIVPMINIDGVIDGFHHVGSDGENMNHSWMNPDPFKHPVLYHLKALMTRCNEEGGIEAFIDFHGTSSECGTFLVGSPFSDAKSAGYMSLAKERLLPKILAQLCDSFSLEKCQFPQPRRINDPPRSVVRRTFGVVNSFAIKTSFGGIASGLWANSLYNEVSWKEIGAKVAESLFHLFSDKPSYVLKSVENSSTFSNSSSPKSKLNSSFDYSDSFNNSKDEQINDVRRRQIEDEQEAVLAIDTGDGIKILSGNSGPNLSASCSRSGSSLRPNNASNSSSSFFSSRPPSGLASDSSNPRFKSSSSAKRSPSPKSNSEVNRSPSPKSGRSPSPRSNWNPNADAKSGSNVRTNLNQSSESSQLFESKYNSSSKSNWNSNSDSKTSSTRANMYSSSESKPSWSSRYSSNSNIRPNINSNSETKSYLVSRPNTNTKSGLGNKNDSKPTYSSPQMRSNMNTDSKPAITVRPNTNSNSSRPNSSLKLSSDSTPPKYMRPNIPSNSHTANYSPKPVRTANPSMRPSNYSSNLSSDSSAAARAKNSLSPYTYKQLNSKPGAGNDASELSSRSFASQQSENSSFSNINASEVTSSCSSLLSNSAMTSASSFKSGSSSTKKRVTFQSDIYQKIEVKKKKRHKKD